MPRNGRFQKDIKEQLELLEVRSFEIQLQYDPAWTTDWITEDAKKKLKKYGIAPPAHSTSDKTTLMGQKARSAVPKV